MADGRRGEKEKRENLSRCKILCVRYYAHISAITSRARAHDQGLVPCATIGMNKISNLTFIVITIPRWLFVTGPHFPNGYRFLTILEKKAGLEDSRIKMPTVQVASSLFTPILTIREL